MAGYLDQYGSGEERREKLIKYLVLTVVAVLIIGGGLFFVFHNYKEERQAQRFFDLLARKDYKAAYAMWGCTDAKPCRDYPFVDFMRDWTGPYSGNPADYKITKSRSCGSGVILTVEVGKSEPEKLWVQRNDLTLGYSPWPGCPQR